MTDHRDLAPEGSAARCRRQPEGEGRVPGQRAARPKRQKTEARHALIEAERTTVQRKLKHQTGAQAERAGRERHPGEKKTER